MSVIHNIFLTGAKFLAFVHRLKVFVIAMWFHAVSFIDLENRLALSAKTRPSGRRLRPVHGRSAVNRRDITRALVYTLRSLPMVRLNPVWAEALAIFLLAEVFQLPIRIIWVSCNPTLLPNGPFWLCLGPY